MRRILTWATAFTLLGIAVSFFLQPVAAAGEDYGGDEIQNMDLYWYEVVTPNDDGHLNTTLPTSETDTRSPCPQQANTNQDGPADVGEWRTDFIETNVTISGNVSFTLWAQAEDGDAVDNVFFTLYIFGLQITTDPHGVGDQPVMFTGSAELTDDITIPRENAGGARQDIDFRLEYDGDDEWFLGNNDQIYVLSSSEDHPSSINFNIDHSRALSGPAKVDLDKEQYLINATFWSAFGNEDLDYSTWDIELRGERHDYVATEFEVPYVTQDDGASVSVMFTWNYNAEEAPSDTYYITLLIDDIQGNTWTQVQVNPIPLIFSNQILNLEMSEDGIMVDGQAFRQKTVVDKRVTVSAVVKATGDTNVQHNPVKWSLYAMNLDNGSTTADLIETGSIDHLPVGEQREVDIDWTPNSKGSYRIYIVLDELDWVAETDENDNTAELLLEVIAKEDTQSEAFLDRIKDNQEVAALVGIVIVASVLIIIMFAIGAKGGGRRRYRDFEDEDEWEDDF